jgi:hypothetical protein
MYRSSICLVLSRFCYYFFFKDIATLGTSVVVKYEKQKLPHEVTIPKSNINMVGIDTPYTRIHGRLISWLGTNTSIKSGVN